MELKLIVIRTSDIEKLSTFYSNFGLSFEYHKHGNSPYHYSALVGKTIIEIYPLLKSQTNADKSVRLGFEIDDFDSVIESLKRQNIVFSQQPIQTDFGFIAVVEDIDGRKIELHKKD